MSDICLMAPKDEEYSQMSDEDFDYWTAYGLISEFSIDVVAFWKYNVKVLSYEETYVDQSVPSIVDSFIATATTTLKSGFALPFNPASIIEVPLNSANSYAPNLLNFNATNFFRHRGKWYIHYIFGSPEGAITADFSSLVIRDGSGEYYTTYTFTSLETFY